jgi:prepilin peptidase dependent protein B
MNPKFNQNLMPYIQHGITLLELLISMLIGLFILGVVLGLFVSMIRSDTDNVKAMQLSQELRAAMSLMSRDIRRAGANRNAAVNSTAATPTNPFSSTSTANTSGIATQLAISGGGSTIMYAYDETSDAVVELFGFRRNSIAGTERVEHCAGSTGVAAGCGTWQPITDENLVKITNLTFVDNSVCEADVNVRQITITLTGELRSDATTTRTISETVKLRNDEFNLTSC